MLNKNRMANLVFQATEKLKMFNASALYLSQRTGAKHCCCLSEITYLLSDAVLILSVDRYPVILTKTASNKSFGTCVIYFTNRQYRFYQILI